jgi:hypothetical protein
MRYVCAIFVDERFVFTIDMSNRSNNESIGYNKIVSKNDHKKGKMILIL